MTARIVFVTTELAPSLPGGAGTVIAELSRRLARGGQPVTVVVVHDGDLDVDLPGDLDVVVVAPDAGATTPFLGRSDAAARAVAELASAGGVARVEFVDFDGLAFTALARRDTLGLTRVPLTVRLHGPVDLMAEAMGAAHEEWGHVRVMERHVFRMADAVVVPSPSLGTLVSARYGTDAERIVVGEPPVVPPPPVQRRPAASPEFVALGRLGEVKGSHDLVDAAVSLLEDGYDLTVRLLGADGWSVTAGRPMRAWLRDRVPGPHRDRFRFEDPVDREQLAPSLATAWAVVVASRFESFCLAAHEARALGHAVVVPQLPAFRPYFSPRTGALTYDGSVTGLAAALRRLCDDRELADRLAAAPTPTYGDPLDAYAHPVTARHPRSQAGLATAALTQLEEVIRQRPQRGWAATVGKAVLRRLPEPAARAAVRVLPAAIKDRFRRYASWPEEQARRTEEARRLRLRSAVQAGAFPKLDAPEISVVIPCFNQGRYLDDAIRSVFEQTLTSFEVIVVDDGSTDPETHRLLDALDWPRLRVVRQHNRGLPAARNSGITSARGRFVVPLDADDQLTPGFVETLRDALLTDPQAAYAHCWARLFGDVDGIYASRPFNRYQQLLSNGVVGCVVLRRAAWEAVGGYAEDMREGNEDWDLWLRLMSAGWAQVQVREPLFRYRKHGVSMSVETEARFEQAQAQMPRRHPALYRERALRHCKSTCYPWVSVVISPACDLAPLARQTLDDVEVVTRGAVDGANEHAVSRGWPCRQAPDDLASAVRSARGKFLIDWDRVAHGDERLLAELAAALEDRDDAVGAGAAGDPEPVLWRRWSLLDPGAPHQGTVAVGVDVETVGAQRLSAGGFPDPRWMVPATGEDGAPVHRQPPEERGRFPQQLALPEPAA